MKIVGLVMSWPVTLSTLCLKRSNVGRKNVKIVQIDLVSWNASDYRIGHSLIRESSEHNIYGKNIN
jgi:hypothetical protein